MPANTPYLRLQALLLLCLSCLASCGSFEEKRIRELLTEAVPELSDDGVRAGPREPTVLQFKRS